MKKKLLTVLALAMATPACAYGTMTSHNGKLYIGRNDNFLFGALRKMYECTTDGAGNMVCVQAEGRP
jgi:hypothetical protein